jgi:hypothetical protein
MIVYPQEVLASYTEVPIFGLAITVVFLAATVAALVVLLRDAWRFLKFLIQTAAYALRGEQSPWARRREAIKRMQEKVFSREEAMVRVWKYAEAKGHSTHCPFDIRLQFLRTEEERKEDLSIGRFVYRIHILPHIPGTIVEIDAIDGTLLKWHTLPR